MEAMVHIGKNLKRVRVRRALTQRELAKLAGVDKNTVALAERDKVEPHMTTVRALAEALRVDPAELVEGSSAGDDNE